MQSFDALTGNAKNIVYKIKMHSQITQKKIGYKVMMHSSITQKKNCKQGYDAFSHNAKK